MHADTQTCAVTVCRCQKLEANQCTKAIENAVITCHTTRYQYAMNILLFCVRNPKHCVVSQQTNCVKANLIPLDFALLCDDWFAPICTEEPPLGPHDGSN